MELAEGSQAGSVHTVVTMAYKYAKRRGMFVICNSFMTSPDLFFLGKSKWVFPSIA